MRRPFTLLLLTAAAASFGGAAFASADITVALNQSLRVSLKGAAASVVIGDPAVADVSMTDAHSVILLGRGYGSTRLFVTDRHGRQLLAGQVNVVAPDDGHVTIYRGVAASEYACAGGAHCQVLSVEQPSAANAGSASASAAAAASPAPAVQPPSAASSGGEAAAAAAAGAPGPIRRP
jgi:Flp pilus assembly secretin CpaC